MNSKLENLYDELLSICNMKQNNINNGISLIIREALKNFCVNHKNVAIWCNGVHTRMLVADYINELKQVNIIIDNKMDGSNQSGYLIISQEKIRDNKIDGIIISSYTYADEIKKIITDNFAEIDYLDIYDELKLHNINLKSAYYMMNHPYNIYITINDYKKVILNERNEQNKANAYINLVKLYIKIKDFKLDATPNLKHKAMIATMYSGGLRVSEVTHLHYDDISRTNKTIHIRDGKSRFDRYTLLADRTLEILTEYWFKCGRPTGILIPSSWSGDYLVKDSVIQFFRKSAKRAGIQKHVSTHCLCHSFASHLFEAGCDVKYIQALLGHRDPRSTEIYLHVSNKTLLGIKSPFDKMGGE